MGWEKSIAWPRSQWKMRLSRGGLASMWSAAGLCRLSRGEEEEGMQQPGLQVLALALALG